MLATLFSGSEKSVGCVEQGAEEANAIENGVKNLSRSQTVFPLCTPTSFDVTMDALQKLTLNHCCNTWQLGVLDVQSVKTHSEASECRPSICH